jgi:AcrR family transcriptional regulator
VNWNGGGQLQNTKAPRKAKSRSTEDTKARLVSAAMSEFNKKGYFGTDTNQIARAAGFAPQTFYRHFSDKTAIFLQVYDRWWRDESAAIQKLSRRSALSPKAAAVTALSFHLRWKIFRRSLRLLTVEDRRVGAARTAARHAQLMILDPSLTDETRIAVKFGELLTVERLCDAAADGEFAVFGIHRDLALDVITEAMSKLLTMR